MSNPPASAPCEETPPTLTQPMQTRSTRKKFKVEFHSKWNEERHKPSGKTPEDPVMNPLGEFKDFGEDENVASHRTPYLPPVRPGVQPPRQTTKFTLCTPLLPQGVQLVRTMTGKIYRLKYAEHDTNDRGKFPQFAPGKYLHSVHYPKAGMMLLEVKQWAAGLEQAGLLKMMNVPYFGRSTQVTIVVKKLLELVHDGHLWIGS